MAPERFNIENRARTYAMDVYAYGCVCYMVLSFAGCSQCQVDLNSSLVISRKTRIPLGYFGAGDR
jgi:hypothetical protein